jgi:hypothetical protein
MEAFSVIMGCRELTVLEAGLGAECREQWRGVSSHRGRGSALNSVRCCDDVEVNNICVLVVHVDGYSASTDDTHTTVAVRGNALNSGQGAVTNKKSDGIERISL